LLRSPSSQAPNLGLLRVPKASTPP
jgi:hypothetical protein